MLAANPALGEPVKIVEFWRTITNSHGRPFRSSLLSVRVPNALDDDQAVDQAKRTFCAWGRVHDWANFAHGYDIRHESLEAPPKPPPIRKPRP